MKHLFTLLLCMSCLSAGAGTTAFTYQGRLADTNGPSSGTYDLQFTLFDAETNGLAVGSVTNLATSITNGQFTTVLDFGAVFTGPDYWLAIGVRTNGASDFEVLSPRQALMPVPYALHAAMASVADVAGTALAVPAAHLTGTVADTQLSSNVVLLAGSPSFAGAVSAPSFTGSGSGLTNVPGTVLWQMVSGISNQTLPNMGYIYSNNATVTFTLPSSANPGDVVYISGVGSGSWKLLQNAGQSVRSTGNLLAYTAWTNRAVPSATWVSIACSADGKRVMAVANSSPGSYPANLLISADGGASWRSNTFSYPYGAAMSADGSSLMTGSSYSYSLNYSSDYGISWSTYLPAGQGYLKCVAMSADGTKLYAAGTSGGYIYYSPDSGVDWISRTSVSATWNSLACSSDGARVVAASSSGVLYNSSNYGANFTQRLSGSTINALAVSSDASQIVVGNTSGIRISTDYGLTWSVVSPLVCSAVASSADGTKLIAAVNGGSIYTSSDSGLTWVQQTADSKTWYGVALSADGKTLYASGSGQVAASSLLSRSTTTTGVTGWLQGPPNSTIQLLHVGGGLWTIIHTSGELYAF